MNHYDNLSDAELIALAATPLRPTQWQGLAAALAERLEMRHRDIRELEISIHAHLILDKDSK